MLSKKFPGSRFAQEIGFFLIIMSIGLVLTTCFMKSIKSHQRENGMKTSDVLPNQKVNMAFNEEEIVQFMDLCKICRESLEMFSPEDCLKMEWVDVLENKLLEAHQNLWQIKEIKTRKNSILQHMDFQKKTYNPKLMI